MKHKSGKPLWDLDWNECPTEVDLINFCGGAFEPDRLRTLLEVLNIKVNSIYAGPPLFLDYLGGKLPQAKYVVINCHGYSDDKMNSKGFVIRPGEPDIKGLMKLLPPEKLKGRIKTPGRVILSVACSSGRPNLARLFVDGGAKAYIGAIHDEDGLSALSFIWNFFFQMVVNKAPVWQAYERARLCGNAETEKFRLYTRESFREKAPEFPEFVTMRAPCVLEDFSGANLNDLVASGGIKAVLAPGGRAGRAAVYEFSLKKRPDSWFEVKFTPFQKWIGAKALAFDTYVPFDVPLKKSLEIWIHLASNKKRVSRWFVPRIKLDRGWNEIRIPFDSKNWLREGKTNCVGKPSRPDLKKLAPLRYVSFRMTSRDPKASAVVYLSNLRLE